MALPDPPRSQGPETAAPGSTEGPGPHLEAGAPRGTHSPLEGQPDGGGATGAASGARLPQEEACPQVGSANR